ncbi:MAG: benzylsuccinate synthase subunit gamma [Deltaproteobacteria bacterium]|nr:MAG: benzylsuccinate synthase subunit gamma [Deltaproteobacteria bacterium]
MPKCKDCKWFFPIPEEYDDYEPGKGDCVLERVDRKGKWWVSRPVFENNDASKCEDFTPLGSQS